MPITDVYLSFMCIVLVDMGGKYTQALLVISNMYHRFDRVEIKMKGAKFSTSGCKILLRTKGFNLGKILTFKFQMKRALLVRIKRNYHYQ